MICKGYSLFFVLLRDMKNSEDIKFYSEREELANALSHMLGILLGIVAGVVLLRQTIIAHSFWGVLSVSLYLFGMLGSYITSVLYHAYKHGKTKARLRKFDHAAIYFHIAGTYAPFSLITLRSVGLWGWALFTFVYVAAIAGTWMSFRKLKKHSNLETVCFVGMGTIILVSIKPLYDTLSMSGQLSSLYWLIAGGVSYIVGALFYSWTKKQYMHFVFHLFVLGGSVCHIMAIYRIV